MLRRLGVSLLAAGWLGCAHASAPHAPAPAAPAAATAAPARPRPYPVSYPMAFQRAIDRDTRTASGRPGPRYWSNRAAYTLEINADPARRRVEGTEDVEYYNRSPDTLHEIYVNLIQNFHAPGVRRLEPAEITGGIHISRVAVGDDELSESGGRTGAGYRIDGTVMRITPSRAVAPGDSIGLSFDWSFAIPERGAGGRMGYSDGDDFFIAYFYPQIATYDDVIGWDHDPFLGTAEFYADFADYDLTVSAPDGWLVSGTGTLDNAADVLQPDILARLQAAEASDTVVHVITADDFGHVTRTQPGGHLSWHFIADSVRDVAFALTRASNWDAARTPVGDRNGDGRTDYARVDAIWRPAARHWRDAARFAQHAIAFHSRFTGLPYPWPHATAVEGGAILGGGMEFPMMTLIGDYDQRGDSALYYVVAHELGHMWIPMTVNTDERRYAWMDEGTNTFEENQARNDFFPGSHADGPDRDAYIAEARSGDEGPIMRWSDYQYSARAYSVASYAKPATVLVALRSVLGDSVFMRGYRAFFRRWAWKHPYPWDLWNTFQDASGRDLSWFWRSWYYQSTSDGPWFLDQAVDSVLPGAAGTRIVIRDGGWVPMPVDLTVTRADGTTLHLRIPVDRWLSGATRAAVTVPAGSPVTRVEIDAQGRYPDVDRANNTWTVGKTGP
jgi:Peptidase family M1 domain